MKRLVLLLALSAPVMLAGCEHRTVAYQVPPPPGAFSAIAQRGFHDGFIAAQRDIADGRPPRMERHPRFRNPPAPPELFADYRQGFREGYHRALREVPPPAR